MSTHEDHKTTCSGHHGHGHNGHGDSDGHGHDGHDHDNLKPLGADVVAGMIHVYNKKSLKDIHLLDAGCGIGNYSKALIEFGIGKVTLMDESSETLEKAKKNLENAVANNSVVDVVEHKLPNLPFPDNTFDVVLYSLVLHHLDIGIQDDEARRELESAIVEARRVLRKDGTLIVIEITAEGIVNSWYCHINTEVMKKFQKKFPSHNHYPPVFERVGVKCVQKVKLLGLVLEDKFNPEAPLDTIGRHKDPYWSLFNEDELNDAKLKLTALKEQGKLEEFVKEHDGVNTNGLITMFVCRLTE